MYYAHTSHFQVMQVKVNNLEFGLRGSVVWVVPLAFPKNQSIHNGSDCWSFTLCFGSYCIVSRVIFCSPPTWAAALFVLDWCNI